MSNSNIYLLSYSSCLTCPKIVFFIKTYDATSDGKTYFKLKPKHKIKHKVNIDIGTKILKQKCFGSKTNFFNTYSNFRPAIQNYRSRRIRSTYSRGCRSFFLMFFQKFACGLGFAGRGYARKANPILDMF